MAPSTPVEKPAPSAATAPSGSSSSASAATSDSAQQSVVLEQNLMKVVFEDDGTGVREQRVALRVQSQAGVQAFGVMSFAYLSSNESVEFDYVRVRKPDGTVVNTPDYNVQDMPAEVTRVAPMYSDIHEKHVTIKGLGVGDVLEYKLRYRTFKPQIPGQFWWEYSFDKNFICRDCQLQLTVPKDKYLKLLSPDYKPEMKDEGPHRVYLWKTSNLKLKDSSEPVSREAKQPDMQLSTFRSWQEIGAWYNELQRPQLTVTPQIQAKVAELTKGMTSDEDKARAIYNYVATRFHYVSLSFGVGRYQPHPAEDVLENEYGDCKDKHTLLATMLKAAGIEAWPALINAERKLNVDMPSPGQFNHVITYLPKPTGPVWLDTTPEVAPFGMLLVNLRNRQALVIANDKPAELKTTPENPPFPTEQTFTIEGAIDTDGTLKGQVKQTVRGDQEVLVRLGFRGTAPAQWKELVQRISNAEGFGGEVSEVTASAPDDTSKPFEFSYVYTRKSYSDWDNHRIIAPLPFTGLEGAAAQEKKPADPVVLGALGEIVYTANIKLPMDVEKLPADVSLKEAYADFESKYSHVGDVLLMKRTLKVKQNEVPLASWDNYKKFSKALSEDWGAYTELYAAAETKKKDASAAGGSAADGDTSTNTPPEIHEKWVQADAAVKRGDMTTAEEILRDLLKKYPDQQGLHGALGSVYFMKGDRTKALAELLKEEELHPDMLQAYQAAAQYYSYLHQDEDAAHQYRLWLQHDSTNNEAYSGLSSLLYKQKKYPEMLQLWEGAAKKLPDSDNVKRNLGFAYLYNQQVDKGIPLIEETFTADSDPMDFNNASYQLADANLELAKAKEWADKALAALYKQSLKPMSQEEARVNTNDIVATWDTAGWVYYRMGDYIKAEAYLRSAFNFSQSALIGDHLAQLYEKQGKKQQAAHTYRLAYSAASNTPSENAYEKQIKEHFQDLMGANVPITEGFIKRRADGTWPMSPGEELSRARTITITSKPAEKGSAIFSVVFSPGKLDGITFISGDEALEPVAQQITSSKLRVDFPDSTPVRLTRRGLLACSTVSSCDFALLLPGQSSSEQSVPATQ